MLYGALLFSEAKNYIKAFFYLRDSNYSNKPEFSGESDTGVKMQDLKTRIRQSGYKIVENYKNPQEVAALILQDLKKCIEDDFPEIFALTPLETESLSHKACIYIL